MSWFHKHDLQLVSRVYASPVTSIESMTVGRGMGAKLLMGCTTLVWKCSEPSCAKIVVVEALGKELPQEAQPRIEIVPAPGDRCGNSGKLKDGSPCPGCRACA